MIAATPDAELELGTSEPRDLAATIGFIRRGRGDPTLHVVEGPEGWREVWRAQRTPEGTATLRLLVEGEYLRAQAWGPGATWSVDRAPALIGEHDDWRPLDAVLAARDDAATTALSRARRRRRGLRLTSTGIVLEAAVAAVLEQKVTGVEARRAWRRLVLQHGERAPGHAPEGLTVMPDGVGWRSIPDHEWHRAGVGPQRMATIRRVAAVSASLDRLTELEPSALEVALQSIPGVGQWTVAEVLQRSHGHPDLVSVGDAHLPHVVGTWFTGDRVDDAGMLELLAPWAGHRQRIVRLITSLGVDVQSFGARATISDHRGH
ncbi:MAG: DNA-3-methyladenine glycosylase 2 family protein [Microcella sp.]|uniref:DNA-3-methyladenine glycosylase family protein n=1 Tax=Microcella sp. TaxID=1913979 RepID=UPI0024C6CE28|nr:DNA-3-methyladenine glycosylase 2 family protein [Microcella sp.]UYN83101.1 MAG: DNA-3-methyladenine glycosylase 2 family protein [Microcella sp.]